MKSILVRTLGPHPGVTSLILAALTAHNLWDAETGCLVAKFIDHKASINFASFNRQRYVAGNGERIQPRKVSCGS